MHDGSTSDPGQGAAQDPAPPPATPQQRADRLPRVPWIAVAAFVAVSCGVFWLVVLPIWAGAVPAQGPVAAMIISAGMFAPAVATLVVVFLARVPRARRAEFLGLWPLRPAKRVVWFSVAAIFVPILISLLTVGLAWLLGWVRLDLVNFSGYQQMMDAELAAAGMPPETPMMPIGLLVATQLLIMPLAALFNSLIAFGEEVGWRGWLLPALRPLGTWPALILSGAIWGVWHMPVTLLGHNYGLTDWRGVVFMTLACVAWGVLFGWSRLRTGSVWPAVIGHGSLNAAGGTVLMLSAAGHPVDMVLATPMGAAGWIVLAAIAIVLALAGQFRTQPALLRKSVAEPGQGAIQRADP